MSFDLNFTKKPNRSQCFLSRYTSWNQRKENDQLMKRRRVPSLEHPNTISGNNRLVKEKEKENRCKNDVDPNKILDSFT